MLSEIVKDKVDILLLFETILDNRFTVVQFLINSLAYHIDQKEINLVEGYLLFYVDVPSKVLN